MPAHRIALATSAPPSASTPALPAWPGVPRTGIRAPSRLAPLARAGRLPRQRRLLPRVLPLLLPLLLLAAAPSARAQEAGGAARGDTAATVAGVVRGAAGAVLVGAEVTLTPVRPDGSGGVVFGRRVFTDEGGRFRVGGLPVGRVTVAVRRIGYRPASTEVATAATAPVELTLEALPQSLATVVVRDRASQPHRGWAAPFYQRKERGLGRFVTRQEIDRRNPIRTTDVLRTIPGLTVMPSPRGFGYVLRMRGARCDPLVWIDGAPASTGYLDVDVFAPQSLEGIEVYSGPASVPIELRNARGDDACGVIALWSRVPEPRRRPKKVITADELAALVASATVYTAEQVDEPARADTTELIQPIYPDSLRQARVGGEAVVEFVVDTLGVPEAATVGVVAASHPAFGDAVRDAARAARFTPARRQGQRVRQLVQVPVRFEVEAR